MLNPSTADDSVDDHTVRKCVEFAKLLEFGAIEVVNLYAYRATRPADLKAAGWLVGEENDRHISDAVLGATLVICAWGVNARGHARAADVLQMLRLWCDADSIRALRLTNDGVPCHPLMLPYSCRPVPMFH